MSRAQHSKQSLGAMLIVLGAVFLVDNLNLFPYDITHYLFKWQSIMIIIGVVMLATKPEKNTGIILVAIGAFFLLPEFELLEWISLRTWWPAILIVAGLLIIAMQQDKNGTKEKTAKQDSSGSIEDENRISIK